MKCQFTKPDGTQCKANAMSQSSYCFSHNPDTQAEKELAVLKGGLAPKPRKDAEPLEPVELKTTEDIVGLLADTINRIRVEPLSHQRANAIGYLCGVLLKAIEVGRLDDQLKLVQSILDQRKI